MNCWDPVQWEESGRSSWQGFHISSVVQYCMLSLLGLVDPPCSLPLTQETASPGSLCYGQHFPWSLYSCSRINQNFLFPQGYKRSVVIFKNDVSKISVFFSSPPPPSSFSSFFLPCFAQTILPAEMEQSCTYKEHQWCRVNEFPAPLNWVSMALMSCGIYEAGFPCPSSSKKFYLWG